MLWSNVEIQSKVEYSSNITVQISTEQAQNVNMIRFKKYRATLMEHGGGVEIK